MRKLCAYCGLEGPLSREHIWPRGIIQRVPEYDARYFGKADKVLSAEPTIRDVCAICNNGVLSELDIYGCSLYDEFFHKLDIRGAAVNFRYDYDLLLRWLLKISYNASRAVGIDTKHLRRCTPYVLGEENAIKDVWVIAALVEPFEGIIHGEEKVVPPAGVRAARIDVSGDETIPFVLRLVSVNAFCFVLVVTKDGAIPNYALAKRLLRGRQIPRSHKRIQLKSSGLDTLEFWSGHLLDKDHLYREHFARRRSET